MNLLGNPTFILYAISCLILASNLMLVWGYSGVARAGTKVAINPEDAARFKTALEPLDPPEVARVLRAYGNAQAAILPFTMVGLVYVLAGGTAGFAKIDFAVFVVARVLHSVVYIAGKQPWRTLAFLGGVGATLALMVKVVLLLVGGV